MTINIKKLPEQILLTIITAIFLVILWCINLLPYRVKLAIGKSFGWLLYTIPNSRTRITRINIKLCFPELTDEDREQLVRTTFLNSGAGIIETAMSWWDRPEKIHAMTEFRGLEYLQQAKQQGKGLILLGAHFFTVDLSPILAAPHHQTYVVYREQTNRLLNWVITRARNRILLGCIPHTSLRGVAKKIMAGESVWYSPDQDMGVDHSVFAPFFGQNAATIVATAKLARLTRAPVVMIVTYRKPDDSGYVVQFLPGPEGYPVEDEVENATMINQLIEQGIKLAPAHYFWFHRRFKTQPGLAKAALYQ